MNGFLFLYFAVWLHAIRTINKHFSHLLVKNSANQNLANKQLKKVQKKELTENGWLEMFEHFASFE